MSTLERIAFYQGRRDEVPNQELAKELAERRDGEGVAEIAEHLWDRNKSVASDCIKVLYEIGYINPQLIEPYTEDFIRLLGSSNNRMVWGGMIALWTVADTQYETIWDSVDEVVRAMDEGTVITVVSGVKALAIVASKDPEFRERLSPYLLDILRTCEPKRVASHAEDMLVMVDEGNRDEIVSILESRRRELSTTQMTRMNKVMKALA